MLTVCMYRCLYFQEAVHEHHLACDVEGTLNQGSTWLWGRVCGVESRVAPSDGCVDIPPLQALNVVTACQNESAENSLNPKP